MLIGRRPWLQVKQAKRRFAMLLPPPCDLGTMWSMVISEKLRCFLHRLQYCPSRSMRRFRLFLFALGVMLVTLLSYVLRHSEPYHACLQQVETARPENPVSSRLGQPITDREYVSSMWRQAGSRIPSPTCGDRPLQITGLSPVSTYEAAHKVILDNLITTGKEKKHVKQHQKAGR